MSVLRVTSVSLKQKIYIYIFLDLSISLSSAKLETMINIFCETNIFVTTKKGIHFAEKFTVKLILSGVC